MPTSKADWQAMNSMADSITDQTAAQIKSQLQNLQSALDTLVPQWQSDAASAFYAVNQEWQDKASAVNTSLINIADGLRESASHYQQMDQQAGDSVRNVGQF
jgi:WXG100 family type VII secretion target